MVCPLSSRYAVKHVYCWALYFILLYVNNNYFHDAFNYGQRMN